ncbi:MAG: LacI family DNA-binding transcriptional regulator [Candidatus Bathyarchaeota archaeon]|nr:LacI family DNA-binding transcriptional regulator [Candidatus Bathyarchaeota archaeon]
MTPLNEEATVLNELKKISKILLLANSEQLDCALGKIADNDTRKKIWVLIDGKRMPKDIAGQVGVSLATVSRFLDSASAADLVIYAAKYPPVKKLDYVPSSWLDLVFGKTEEELEQKTSKDTTKKDESPENGAKKA